MSKAFQFKLPNRAAIQIEVARFDLCRKSDCASMARRARMLGALACLETKSRNQLAKAVNEACRVFIAGSTQATVHFGIGEYERRTVVEAAFACPEVDGRIDLSADGMARLKQAGQGLLRCEISNPSEPPHIVLSQATGTQILARPEQIADWGELLRAATPEEAVAIAQHGRQTSNVELGVARLREGTWEAAQAAEANRSDLETLSLVVSRTPIAILISDASGAIQWANNAFSHLTKYDPHEHLGQRIDALLFGPSSDTGTVRDVQEALAHGYETSSDVLHYRKDGTTFWGELAIIPVHDDGGTLSRWIGIITDITRRRQTEDALRQAKQSAESSSRSKSEFLANMSHEIRTPLNAVLGMTELALATQLTTEQRDYLKTVHASADTLLRLLNDILDISKIEAGKMELEDVDFNLHQVVRDTVKALSAKADEKDIGLRLDIPPDLPTSLRGDPVRIRQVLFNLVGNAIKFTERGEVAVQIEEQWRTGASVGLCLTIQDTGIGIRQDRLEQIFESFTQVDSSVARRFGGTGLGLAITAQLLQMMNGKIWVQSEEGVGSTFRVTIPLQFVESAGNGPAQDQIEDDASLSSLFRKKASTSLQVLVVDDHQANRDLVSEIIERRGHCCVSVGDGKAAVDICRDKKFDLVLMDVQMPGLDGLSATQQIREMESEQSLGDRVPIVALTAHALAGDKERCLNAGMNEYLAKPIHAGDLLSVVERLAGLSQATVPVPDDEPTSVRAVPFDIAAALARMGGEVDLLKEHIGYVLNDLPELLRELRKAIVDDDYRTLEISAHRLKGLVSSYNYDEARDLAQALELSGKQQDSQSAQEKLDRLEQMVPEFVAAVSHYLKQQTT